MIKITTMDYRTEISEDETYFIEASCDNRYKGLLITMDGKELKMLVEHFNTVLMKELHRTLYQTQQEGQGQG